jgi:hypothetical protein
MPRALIATVIVFFGGLTGVALWQHGYWGIVEPHLQSFAGAQVFVDLLIAWSLVMVWMWRDATAQGRNPWPWILALGSFGPLLFLLTRPQVAPAEAEG